MLPEMMEHGISEHDV